MERRGEKGRGLVFKIPLLHNCKEKTDHCPIITSAMQKKQKTKQNQNRNIPKIQQTENVFL